MDDTKKNYFEMMASMTPEQRSQYFREKGRKGGIASKMKGTDYRALSRKRLKK